MEDLEHYSCFAEGKLLSHVFAHTQQDAYYYFVNLYKMEVFRVKHITPERVTFYANNSLAGYIGDGIVRKTKHKPKYNTPTANRFI